MLKKVLINHIKVYLRVLKRVQKISDTKEDLIKHSVMNEILISKLRSLEIINQVNLMEMESISCVERLNFFTEKMQIILDETNKMNVILNQIKKGEYSGLVTNQMVIDVFNDLEEDIKQQLLLGVEIENIQSSQSVYIDDSIKDFILHSKENLKANF